MATRMGFSAAILRDYLPPATVRWLRGLRGGGITFSGDYADWSEARAHSGGYDATEILAKVLDSTLAVKRGEAAYERDSVLFQNPEYVWPLLAALMWAAARDRGRLDVLDFGGSLGSKYFQHRPFLQDLPEVRWNIVEQPSYVECGQAHVADKTLRFYENIATCLAENAPNVILLSSVLQYLPDPYAALDDLRGIGAKVMLIERTPVASIAKDRLLVQSVPPTIYAASYPVRVFAGERLEERLAHGWHTLARYTGLEGQMRSQEGLEFTFECWLLEAS